MPKSNNACPICPPQEPPCAWLSLKLRLIIILLVAFPLSRPQAAVILQVPQATTVAFEAENFGVISNTAPTLWQFKDDAEASGGKVLVAGGENQTLNPSSFISYSIKFATPGTYTIYYRWKADVARAGNDINSANSFKIPNKFGAGTDVADYVTSVSNGTGAPNSTNKFNFVTEPGILEVTQADVDAGVPLLFTLGTREAGLSVDRIVLSTDPALTEAAYNLVPNSDVDIIVQSDSQSYVAFEAESKGVIANTAPTLWQFKDDAEASGGKVLVAGGENQTLNPSSFISYSIKFATPGTYTIYYRWKADVARAGNDINSANSFKIPNKFGAGTDVADYVTSVSNGTGAPNSTNKFNFVTEPGALEVTQADVDAGVPLVFTLGTREAGLSVDRIVLSTDPALTEAAYNALPNTGGDTVPPKLRLAVGSSSFTRVTLSFDEALDAATVVSGGFHIAGLTVSDAQVDAATGKKVTLVTTPQTKGLVYTVTVTGVKDASGNTVTPGTTVNFTAWKLATGWVERDFYTGITGNNVSDFADSNVNPNYPDNPDGVDAVKNFAVPPGVGGSDYGVRVVAFFTPTETAAYDFFMYSDDGAELFLSTDDTFENLQSLLTTTCCAGVFAEDVVGTSPTLTKGAKYLLQALLKQGGGAVDLEVAIRKSGDTTPAASLPAVSGDRLSAYYNPDLSAITFKSSPANANATAGSRARFAVTATSAASPLYYQWQVNGVDIPGAIRSSYTTPILQVGDSGKQYHVVVSVGGTTANSSDASLNVTLGAAPTLEPYIGVNFVGGGGGALGTLLPTDVTGVAAQDNWNNLSAVTLDNGSLVDAHGAASPVAISYTANAMGYTGAIGSGADPEGLLLQGYLHNNNTDLTVTLANVPAGKYNLYLYSVGFDFNATYESGTYVQGSVLSPTNHVTAQRGSAYTANPGFHLMGGTNANARQTGNYQLFENVEPAADHSLSITLLPEAPIITGNLLWLPALNAIQLVKVLQPATQSVNITGATKTATSVNLVWTGGEGPFLIEGKMDLSASTWTKLLTTTERTASIPLVGSAMFLRIQDKTTDTVKLFRAEMNGANEVPAIVTPGTGRGLLAVNGTQGFYLVSYENLRGAATLSHIHGPAPAGAGGGVLIGLANPTGTSGFITGTITVTAGNLTTIEAGNTYFNIHCAPPGAGGGEIRGQLVK